MIFKKKVKRNKFLKYTHHLMNNYYILFSMPGDRAYYINRKFLVMGVNCKNILKEIK